MSAQASGQASEQASAPGTESPRGAPINIAVMALGGQGGGVLVDWIVALAEARGWIAQATSVAGVAQRTGATIYYLELVPPDPQGRTPVLAQMPVPGDVDVLIAAELMEAGRAALRGFVTPARTTVITSTHRAFSVDEKTVAGNGVADGERVLEQVRASARRLVAADMQALAVAASSVISASLFGALAGSGALPFAAADFEIVVRDSGVGVEASLRALRAGRDAAAAAAPPRVLGPDRMVTAPRALPERAASPLLQPLLEHIRRDFPAPAWDMLGEGLQRVVDFQDLDYGRQYLQRVAHIAALDTGDAARQADHALTREAAQWIAVAMAYDDVIRVAELKSREERFARIRGEVGVGAHEPVGVEDFLHPRLEELCGLLPRRLGGRVLESPAAQRVAGALLRKGRRLRSSQLWGYLQLRLLAGMRRWRRASLRHAQECEHLQQWLDSVQRVARDDYALAVEMLRCRRLVKGYSDTHARGSGRFDRLLAAARGLHGSAQAAQRVAELRRIALSEAGGSRFDDALRALG